MYIKNWSKEKYLKDDLVIYSYCYPDAVKNNELRQENQRLKGVDLTPGYIKTKVGDTAQGLDEGLTIDESGKLRMSQQGGTGESDKKIVVGTWGVSKNNIKRDFVIHNELKRRGLRPVKDKDGNPILDGQGKEFFLIPGNTVEEVHQYLQDVIISFGASANEKLILRKAQERIINERLENYNSSNSERVDHVSNLCPRFGKTTEELHYFNKINKKIMMGPSAVLSTHTSFRADIARFRDFKDIEYITTHENPDYEKDIKKAFSQGKRVFVTVSLFAKNKKYFKFLRNIPNGDKYICVDEGDFAAWTPKKREVLEYLIPKNNTGKFCVNTMSGTNMPRMVTGAESIDGVFTSTYMELEQSEDNIIKRRALKMTLSDTDEYVSKLTKEDYFSWTKFWENPYKSENFAVNFMEGTLSESEEDNLNYKNLALSNPMKQTVNCIMMFGSGGINAMDDFKNICLKSEKLKKYYNFVVLHSGHTTNAKAQDYVRQQINLTKREGKRGLIIISNTMGSRSFSISEIQATLICYDKGGEDPTQQRISRPLTPGKLWDGETDKELGHIVTYSMDPNRDTLITNLLTIEAAQYSANNKVSIQKANKILTNNVSILTTGLLGNVVKIEPDKLLEEMSSSKILSKVAFALSKPEKILNDSELLDKFLSMTVGKKKKIKEDTQLPKAKNFITNNTKNKSAAKKQSDSYILTKKMEMLCNTVSMVTMISKGNTYRTCLQNISSPKFEKIYGINKKHVIKALDINGIPEIQFDSIVASTNNIIKSGDLNKFQELTSIGEFPELGLVESTEKKLWLKKLKKVKNLKNLKIAVAGSAMGWEVSALLELDVPKKNITVINESGFSKLWENVGIKYINKPSKEAKNMYFDLIVGNPPFSKGNKGKGGVSVYQEHAEWALKHGDTVAMITPGSFMTGGRFENMRNQLNEKGLSQIENIPLDTFAGASIVNPVYWVADGGNKKVKHFLSDEITLFNKIIENNKNQNIFNVYSGKGNVSTSDTVNLSKEKTSLHTFRYIDRVLKEGPVVIYSNKSLKTNTGKYLTVFAQRGGMNPKMFLSKDVDGYSQNVIAIHVKDEKQHNNLVELFTTTIYKFMLNVLSGGNNRTRKGMPAAFTTGRIRTLPALDLDVSWTNDKVNKELNLTKDEIKYIESYVG